MTTTTRTATYIELVPAVRRLAAVEAAAAQLAADILDAEAAHDEDEVFLACKALTETLGTQDWDIDQDNVIVYATQTVIPLPINPVW